MIYINRFKIILMVALGIVILPLFIAGLILQIIGKSTAIAGYILCFDKASAKYEYNDLKSDIARIWKDR